MKIKLIIPAIAVMFFAGCSSSLITHSWKSDTIIAPAYKKIMVVGLIRYNDRSLREKMETHMTGDLSRKGYTAIASLEEYGPKSFENMKEEEAISKLHTSGIDAVVTIVLLHKRKERNYTPPRANGNFWMYYTDIASQVYTTGYYNVETKYFWESNFYDLASGKLIYSVQTESFDPNSAESMGHEYGKMIVADMAKKGIIK
ncbi:MAG: hypothetical protein ABI581_13980 [Sediminibacterium sp.]